MLLGYNLAQFYGKFPLGYFLGYFLIEFGRNFVQTVWSHWTSFGGSARFCINLKDLNTSYYRDLQSLCLVSVFYTSRSRNFCPSAIGRLQDDSGIGVDSAKDSCKLVKKLLAITVSSIAYLRFNPQLA